MDERLLIQLSAWCDGELDGSARTEFERQIAAHPEWLADIARYRRLDAVAAALAVPVPGAARFERLFEAVSPADMEKWLRDHVLPEAIAHELQNAPVVDQEQFAKMWAGIAGWTVAPVTQGGARNSIEAQSGEGVPAIGAEKWNRVWNGIQSNVAARSPAKQASAVAAKVVRARARAWRWIAATGLAAVVAIGVTIHFYPLHSSDEAELPSGSNDRYEVSIEYDHGESVVCYYLKIDDTLPCLTGAGLALVIIPRDLHDRRRGKRGAVQGSLTFAVAADGAVAAIADCDALDDRRVRGERRGADCFRVEPGKTASIPASLKKYEQELKDEPFSTFTDSGHDSVTATAGGAAGTCTVAGYAVEVTVMEKNDGAKVKVQITIKQGGKAVGQPWKTELKDAHPLRVKVGEPKATGDILLHVQQVSRGMAPLAHAVSFGVV